MQAVTAMWAWLGANHDQIGALSSLVFGISTAFIALMAYRLSYRNNFGWKPIAWLVTSGLKREKIDDPVAMTIEFEVWNRRKYPLVIRGIKVTPKKFRFADGVRFPAHAEFWFTCPDALYYRQEFPLQPNESKLISAQAILSDHDQSLRDKLVFELSYFDPKKGTQCIARSWAIYDMGLPRGWSKDKKIKAAVSSFSPARIDQMIGKPVV